MRQRRQYRNPPVEEAICEFRFTPSRDWDSSIPGRLQSQLVEYSGKPRQVKEHQFEIQVRSEQPPDLQYGERLATVRLVTNDERRMLGVGPNSISIHMLRPYQDSSNSEPGGWDEFEPRISTALNAYLEVTGPRSVARIGIRYINRIVVPSVNIRVEEYLKCTRLEMASLPNQVGNFAGRVEYVYEDKVRLLLSHGGLGVSPADTTLLLDLDVIWLAKEAKEGKAPLDVARDLHERASTAFEAVITNKAREVFNAS